MTCCPARAQCAPAMREGIHGTRLGALGHVRSCGAAVDRTTMRRRCPGGCASWTWGLRVMVIAAVVAVGTAGCDSGDVPRQRRAYRLRRRADDRHEQRAAAARGMACRSRTGRERRSRRGGRTGLRVEANWTAQPVSVCSTLPASRAARDRPRRVTCTPLWSASLPDVVRSVAAVAGKVYAASGNQLATYDAAGVDHCGGTPKTCTPLWTASVTGTLGRLTVANGTVFGVAAHTSNEMLHQRLVAVDAAGVNGCGGSPKVCSPLWSSSVGAVGGFLADAPLGCEWCGVRRGRRACRRVRRGRLTGVLGKPEDVQSSARLPVRHEQSCVFHCDRERPAVRRGRTGRVRVRRGGRHPLLRHAGDVRATVAGRTRRRAVAVAVRLGRSRHLVRAPRRRDRQGVRRCRSYRLQRDADDVCRPVAVRREPCRPGRLRRGRERRRLRLDQRIVL